MSEPVTDQDLIGPEPSPEWVESLFTRRDGSFAFRRWGRPIAPAIVGTDDKGCKIFEDAIRNVATLAGHDMQEIDAEFGANLLVFMVNQWEELEQAPNLVRLIPNLADLIGRLDQHGANQYRLFGFDDDGAIRLCIVLLRYDAELQAVSAGTLALGQAFQSMLMWSDTAFTQDSFMAVTPEGLCLIKPNYGHLLRASYDKRLPHHATDPAFSHRIAARMTAPGSAPS